jgi:hypothetical protein
VSSPCFCSYRELTDRIKRQKELKIVAGELQAQRNLMVRVNPTTGTISASAHRTVYLYCAGERQEEASGRAVQVEAGAQKVNI